MITYRTWKYYPFSVDNKDFVDDLESQEKIMREK